MMLDLQFSVRTVLLMLLYGFVVASALGRAPCHQEKAQAGEQTADARKQRAGEGRAGNQRTGEPPPTEPLAYVSGVPIGMPEVRYLLSALRATTTEQQEWLDVWIGSTGQEPSGLLPSEVVDAAVEQWIERLVVLSHLERIQMAVVVARADSDLRALDERLQQLGTSLEAYRARFGISHESLLKYRQWELSWEEFLQRRVTEESLAKYFSVYHRDFDGTRRRVAHIVMVVEPVEEYRERAAEKGVQPEALRTQAIQEAQEKLQGVRKKLVKSELTFGEAARLYSDGPSASREGDLGWVTRDGPLSAPVSLAAFRLEIGHISEPVESPHGVHLLMVLEEELGKIEYPQVKERVRRAAVRDLWTVLVEQERPHLSIFRSTEPQLPQ